jgi:D-sedoheptulose 7-phosphate isomerase
MNSGDQNVENSILALMADQKAAFSNLELHVQPIARAVALIVNSLQSGGKVMWCGNGGSAAEAQHMAAELMGRFNINRNAIASIALTTDTSFLSGYSNDVAFNDVFSRQLQGIGKLGDVLIAYSTSGNSANVVNAVEMAKNMGIEVVTMLGGDGGKLLGLGDVQFMVDSFKTPRIQEVHQFLGHAICHEVERALCG